jgi:hypothetical protein
MTTTAAYKSEYPLPPHGSRMLVLCPRPSCRGDARCPEAGGHVLVPLEKEVGA